MRFSLVPFVFTQSPRGLLYDPNAAPGATDQGTTSSQAPTAAGSSTTVVSPTTPTPTTPGQSTTTTPAGAAGSTTPASATARPGAAGDTWTPPTRETWNATETARRNAIARTRTLEGELRTEQQRVRALSGVATPKPEDAERQQVADAFFELFPQFQIFKDPKIVDRLTSMMARSDELAEASDHVWDGLTRRTLDSIASKFADETGVDVAELTDRDRRELAALFFQMAADDPDGFRTRYEREDPKLVDDFISRMKTRYFDPIRRREANGFVRGQPRVPSSGSSRPVVTTPPNIDFKSRDAVEDAAVNYLKERGHLQQA